MTGNEKITVEKTHTDEMVRDELKAMLGASKIHLTLGALASLAVLKSPYIYGGSVTENVLETAFGLVKHEEMSPLEFHEALQSEIDTAFRVFETIVPDHKESANDKTSEIETFSPEWFSDTIAQACQSMPSLTHKQVLWEMPLVFVFHLAISTARRNGAITRRPNDVKAAIREFKAMRERK